MPVRGRPRGAAALLVSAVLAAVPLVAVPAAAAAPQAPGAQPATVDVTRIVDGRPITSTVPAASERAAESLAQRLDARTDVLAADVTVEYHPVGLAAAPAAADPLLASSAHLHAVRAPRAWERTTGAGTVVAVLDTGVLADHPDLRGAVLPQLNTVPTALDEQPGSLGYHGTLVSSIIAARLGNGVGSAGVAPGAGILPVRICAPTCTSAAMTAGIDAAVARGARVINLSVAGPSYSRVVEEAVNRAVAAGVVVVASSGNDGSPCAGTATTGCGNPVMYPAAHAGVISVSSASATGVASSWAVRNEMVDLSAVGERVLGAVPPRTGSYDGSEYTSMSGTSFSAPQVAGAAALVRSVAPHLGPAAVEEILKSSAVTPAAWPAGYGRGVLDVAAAVDAAAPAPGPVVTQGDGSVRYTRDGASVVVKGAILARYRAAGAEGGFLGWPLTGEVPVRGGAFTQFEHGSVYWSPATGAQVVLGAVRDRWAAMGWELSPLGFPAGEEVPARGGVVQRFTGGRIHWSPATGAHDVRGAILGAYAAAGAEDGVLGHPTTGEVLLRGGAFNHFQGGSVYWSPTTRAQVVRGAIRDAWARQGWETGRLGYPRTGEQAVPGGVRQEFQGGSATYSWDTRQVTITHR
ncbi:LGFP repeat-containing protein [Kineococcus xinjiangensis]|uniref:LGFP repeat-containing protein n=1 Tax=Kineococcus xinjiangensis TaxID=512762 RepID=A0A2S6II90_9ACTN|nr:S8 family serine peptidase [Kineococcus xinjiangensis]PPK93908.1 LGFP repeat-containing protein [Kineococcus xinjiangensis]